MNIRNLSLAVALVAGMVAVTPASANIYRDVQSAVNGTGQVSVSVRGNTAYLHGYTTRLSSKAAERAALADPEIDTVINNLSIGRS